MNQKFSRVLVALAISLLVIHASATPSLPLHETWTSVRALGMGNAYTSIVDDADSLFYNPAGINSVSGLNWTILDLHAGLDDLAIMQTLNSFKDSSNITSLIQSEYGKYHWLNVGTKTAFTFPHFGVALFGNADALLSVANPPYPELRLQYYQDYGGVVGFGFEPVPSFIKFGLDVKYMIRTGTESIFTSDQLATLKTDQITAALQSAGSGYAMDSGLLVTIPSPIRPTLSFVWKNMGCTAFTKTAGAIAPPRIQDEMIIGGSLEITAPLISIYPSLDYKYLNRADVQFGKKISLGVEVSLPILSIRAGFNQGYYTAGVGVNLGVMRVDAATYGEELGEYPGQIEDRRYVVQATFEIGFDPLGLFGGSGSSSSKGGAEGSGNGSSYRRGLKQRR